MSYDHSLKILTLGDTLVGKSCFVVRYISGSFNETPVCTVGIDFSTKILTVNDYKVKISVWDTAGQERFRNITKQYLSGADVVFLMFDISSEVTFTNLDYWIEELKKKKDIENIVLVLIGNKCDLKDKRVVSVERAQMYADKYGIKYFETSAKTNEGIEDAFSYALKTFVKNNKLQREGSCTDVSSLKVSEEISNRERKNQSKKMECC